jgi:hypothetical protein
VCQFVTDSLYEQISCLDVKTLGEGECSEICIWPSDNTRESDRFSVTAPSVVAPLT